MEPHSFVKYLMEIVELSYFSLIQTKNSIGGSCSFLDRINCSIFGSFR